MAMTFDQFLELRAPCDDIGLFFDRQYMSISDFAARRTPVTNRDIFDCIKIGEQDCVGVPTRLEDRVIVKGYIYKHRFPIIQVDGGYKLTIGNDEFITNDLLDLEKKLYNWLDANGHLSPPLT
jgi:hypothetical protein